MKSMKLNPGLPGQKQHLTRQLFSPIIGLKFKDKLVKWSTALHGAETWTFRKLDQKYHESFEIQ